jgi:hypothetical protein
MLERLLTRRLFPALLAAACLVGYFPALNNGYIADDYVILEWAGKFFAHPGFLFSVPPQNFRMTSYVVFELSKRLLGYNSAALYAINIAFHFAACFLLWRLLLRFEDELTAGLATLLFAVFQAPQEAVMWLAAMNETISAIFILATLILWTRGKHAFALLCYSLALISKESAPIVLLLLPLVQWRRREPLFPRAYALYFIPTAIFGIVFLTTWATNSMIHYHIYAVSPQAVVVLLLSLHRLLWPWMYIFVALAWIWGSFRPTLRGASIAVGAIAVPMLPYIFLTYDRHLPSRQLYLASMIFMVILTGLVRKIKIAELRTALVAVFCLWNVFYLASKKDQQFLERAAPTTALLRELQSRSPAHIRIEGFAYPEGDIAKDVAFVVPGWNRDLIDVGGNCSDCVVLRWDPAQKTYKVRLERPPAG